MKSAGLRGGVASCSQSAISSENDENMAAKKQCCNKLIVLLVTGFLLALFGVILFPAVNYFVKEEIKKKVIISNKSENYEIWQNIPVPVYMQFYFFNVYNVEEVKSGQKPFVAQRGPYTYRERRVKFNIVWNSNGTVTYRQNRTFYFIPEMSVGKETDLITTVNPLMATLAQGFQWFPDSIKTIISMVLGLVTDEGMFTTRPVKELLWGYEDPSLVRLKALLPFFITSSNIGYFIGRNYTDDGLYTVSTGETDIKEIGKIQLFNGQRYVNIWTTEWVRMVNGTVQDVPGHVGVCGNERADTLAGNAAITNGHGMDRADIISTLKERGREDDVLLRNSFAGIRILEIDLNRETRIISE